MKNYFSKSTSEFDLQKFFNLVLTEQRAQRVDLARIHKLITDNIIKYETRQLSSPEEVEEPDFGPSDTER